MSDPGKVFESLESVNDLPTIRVIAAQLIDAVGKSDARIDEITRLISVDPSLTSKVLRIANSSFFGLRKKVDTINLAVVILGLNEISGIVLSLSLFKTVQSVGGAAFDPEEFWEHSAMVAHFSRLLARSLGIVMHGEEFTGGLIHDIGKIIQVRYFPEEYEEIAQLMKDTGCLNFNAEQAVMGVSHMELGAWLADRWKFPTHLVDVIRSHHSPLDSEENPVLAAIVFFGDLIARHCVGSRARPFEAMAVDYRPEWELLMEEASSPMDFEAFAARIVEETLSIDEFLNISRTE
jgi:putative nucleotidyltransferase with HDIG domain